MTKHQLKISILKEPSLKDGIVRCRTVSLRERILLHILGATQKVTVIVPGDSVHELSIRELPKEDVCCDR